MRLCWFQKIFVNMKKAKIDLVECFFEYEKESVEWKKINREGLDLDYAIVLSKNVASNLFQELEDSIEYFDKELSKVAYSIYYYEIDQ